MNGTLVTYLPLDVDFETARVLKSLPRARAALAELKGTASTIPNQYILLNTLILREAKDSSEIESIITTHDELYKSQLRLFGFNSSAAKEVENYVKAMNSGFDFLKKTGIITIGHIKKIQSTLENNEAGFRKLPGTQLKNDTTGEIIYTPPQHPEEIAALMSNLVDYINRDSDVDPLIRMAVIHHQFESIHPFYDGNGRTGRILNILFLVHQGLLNIPILYLSSYITRNKTDYYRLLQEVRIDGKWEDWILYMIEGIRKTALDSIDLVSDIKELMMRFKHEIRDNYKFYSQDLINNLFAHPYTKIDFLQRDLQVTRLTATSYLNQLVEGGYLEKLKYGRSNYYVNHQLFQMLSRP